LVAALAAAGLVALHAGSASAADGGLTYSQVTFTGSDGVVLHGTVVAPAPAGGNRPGIVLVGGAGPGKRSQQMPPAEAFARGGVVSLVYDKRTAGYSQFQRSYSVLTDDALAAVRVLRAQAGVDPRRVGFWGRSEGAWVASLGASRSTDVAYLVTVGAAGMGPARQTAWNWGNDLRHAGVSGSLLQTVQQTAARVAVGVGLFPEADYDPVPAWRHVRQPVLALWGVYDQQVPSEESSRIIQNALASGGNTHYEIRFIPDANHQLEVARDGGFGGAGSLLRAPTPVGLAPGYPELVTSWVDGLAEGPAAVSVEQAPRQARQSTPLAPLGWYESPLVQLGAVVVLLLAFAGYPLSRVFRGRRTVPPARVPARVLAATGLATALGLLLYVFFLMETTGTIVGPVVAGRPLPWLVLQVLAVVASLATIATAVASWRGRHAMSGGTRARLGLLLAGGLLLIPWTVYWGLLVP
jgi:dienelactone hydrolase